MRMIRFSLSSIAQWPHESFGPRTLRTRLLCVYHYIMITLSTYFEISCVFYVRRNTDKEFIVMGHDYFNILMGVVILQRMTLSFQKKYCRLVETFVNKFHLKNHQHKLEYAATELNRINKFCNIAAIIIHIQIIFSMMFFNMVPLWKNVKAGMFSQNRPENGTFVHSGNYLSFVNQYTDTTGYFIVFFLNFFPSYNAATIFLCMDLLIFIMVFHIAGHLNVLVHDLRYFPRPAADGEADARKYNDAAYRILKDLIDRDQAIKEFMANISETFGISLCIYLAFHQVTGCVLLLECSPMTPEALGNYGFLTLMMLQQLIQTSVIFEFISTKSDTLADEVYSLPWELMDPRNRKAVLLFLMNVQRPRALKAGGMVSVGVLTMSTILKTSCSYFLMLKTLTVNDLLEPRSAADAQWWLAAAAMAVLTIATIAGNAGVVSWLWRARRSPQHYPLASLAAADLLVGVSVLPLAAARELFTFRLSFIICACWSTLDVLCCTASILSLCVLGWERYRGITAPLLRADRAKNARLLAALVWPVAAAVALPTAFVKNNSVSHNERDKACSVNTNPSYVFYSVTLSFYVPTCIMLVQYGLVLRALATRPMIRSHRGHNRTEEEQHKSDADDVQASERQRRATITIIRLMCLFLVCWTPFFIMLPIDSLCGCIRDFTWQWCTWLGYTNSALNPVVYATAATRVRQLHALLKMTRLS